MPSQRHAPVSDSRPPCQARQRPTPSFSRAPTLSPGALAAHCPPTAVGPAPAPARAPSRRTRGCARPHAAAQAACATGCAHVGSDRARDGRATCLPREETASASGACACGACCPRRRRPSASGGVRRAASPCGPVSPPSRACALPSAAAAPLSRRRAQEARPRAWVPRLWHSSLSQGHLPHSARPVSWPSRTLCRSSGETISIMSSAYGILHAQCRR